MKECATQYRVPANTQDSTLPRVNFQGYFSTKGESANAERCVNATVFFVCALVPPFFSEEIVSQIRPKGVVCLIMF